MLFGAIVQHSITFLVSLIRLNYELVSTLVHAFTSLFAFFTRFYYLMRIFISEFADQYADWCECSLTLIDQSIDMIISVFSSIASIPAIIERLLFSIIHLPIDIISSAYQLIIDNATNLVSIAIICLIIYLFYSGWMRTIIGLLYSIILFMIGQFISFTSTIVTSIICICFPQLALALRLIQLFWRPLLAIGRYILTIITYLLHIRSSPPKQQRLLIARTADNDRLACCVCQHYEKTILIRPCNHLCLCTVCADQFRRQRSAVCPLCRHTVDAYVNVYL